MTEKRENVSMARAKTTVYLEPELLRAARVEAARTGKRDYEIFEDALRSHLGFELLEKTWKRSGLDEAAALKLAYRELHSARR